MYFSVIPVEIIAKNDILLVSRNNSHIDSGDIYDQNCQHLTKKSDAIYY